MWGLKGKKGERWENIEIQWYMLLLRFFLLLVVDDLWLNFDLAGSLLPVFVSPFFTLFLYFILPLSAIKQFSARRPMIKMKVITERFILVHWVILVNDLWKRMKFDTGCSFYDVTPNNNYLFFWMKGKS